MWSKQEVLSGITAQRRKERFFGSTAEQILTKVPWVLLRSLRALYQEGQIAPGEAVRYLADHGFTYTVEAVHEDCGHDANPVGPPPGICEAAHEIPFTARGLADVLKSNEAMLLERVQVVA